MYYSECCWAPADSPLALDISRCPDCKENCEFIEDDED